MATDYSYIGKGKVYMRVAGASAGLTEVGNVSALSFAINEETKELKDYTSAGGGNQNEVRRIASVECSITMHDLSAPNLAMAVFGNSAAISTTPIVDEAVTAYLDSLVPTAKPIDTGTTVTVKHTSGSPTYVKDTDYTLTAAGIIPITGGAITNAQSLKVSYTPKAGYNVQALLNAAQEYELYFAGVNEARSGKAFNVRAFRVKLGAAKSLGLIADDYGGLELTGKVLKDTTKNGTSLSQYFTADIVS